MKQCSKCKRTLPLTKFCKDKKGKNGLSCQCRDCKAAYDEVYRAENWEKKRLTDKLYRERNKEKIRKQKNKYNIEYRKTHVKEIKARAIAYKFPLGDKCEYCGSIENLQRHHPSYDFPEVFETTCQSCNVRFSL